MHYMRYYTKHWQDDYVDLRVTKHSEEVLVHDWVSSRYYIIEGSTAASISK